jgi:hypothetical protein
LVGVLSGAISSRRVRKSCVGVSIDIADIIPVSVAELFCKFMFVEDAPISNGFLFALT